MSTAEHPAAVVRSILGRDTDSVQILTQLLREEREALQKRDPALLSDIVARKLDCLKSMDRLDQERKQCVRRAGKADWPALIDSIDAGRSLGLHDAWEHLVVLLREAAELTEINSRIVSRTQRSTERLLALLRGQSEPVGIYDKLGRTRAYGDNRPVVSA